MLIAEYSYEEDIQVKQQEAEQQGRREGRREGRQEGRREGRQEGLILSGRIFQMVKMNPDFTNEQIALETGCDVEEVESTRKMFGI